MREFLTSAKEVDFYTPPDTSLRIEQTRDKMSALSKEFTSALDFMLLKRGTKVAVACSGGVDSLALTLITHEWAKTHGIKLVAVTVDHGLRKESGNEAALVTKWLAKYGVAHVILKWEGNKPKSNIQQSARNARYQLLTEYCKSQDIRNLLVAHTLDDQAETFLLRLRRGSGVDGLSAMAEHTIKNGINVLRPLLGIRKAALIDYLKSIRQEHANDQSNENLAYDRIKIRKFIPELENVGISVEKLAKTATNMARAREYLRKQVDDFITANCTVFNAGYAILGNLPESPEIALRVLTRVLITIGGDEKSPRLDSLETLYLALLNPDFKSKTVAGCLLRRGRENNIIIMREPSAVSAPAMLKPGKIILWDRFEVSAQKSGEVGALTQAGWLEISRADKLKNPFPDKKILYTLPALRDENGEIICVPHLSIGSGAAQFNSLIKD